MTQNVVLSVNTSAAGSARRATQRWDDPGGAGGDWNSFAFFNDPDGNGWILQERPGRADGRRFTGGSQGNTWRRRRLRGLDAGGVGSGPPVLACPGPFEWRCALRSVI